MITFKKGVRVNGIKPETVLAIQIAEGVWAKQGLDLVVTSVTDSKHSQFSLHYTGYACDLRIWDLDTEKAVRDLKEALTNEYAVILEDTHIHIEFQPTYSGT